VQHPEAYNCQLVNRSLLMKKAPPLRQRGQGYEAKKSYRQTTMPRMGWSTAGGCFAFGRPLFCDCRTSAGRDGQAVRLV